MKKKLLKKQLRILLSHNLRSEPDKKDLETLVSNTHIIESEIFNFCFKEGMGIWSVGINGNQKDLIDYQKTMLCIFKFRLGNFTLEEFLVSEELISRALGEKSNILEIKNRTLRKTSLLLYFSLKYGGLVSFRTTRERLFRVQDLFEKMPSLKIPSFRSLGSLYKKLQENIKFQPEPDPNKNPPRTTIKYSGYCKGYPETATKGQPPLDRELQIEEVEEIQQLDAEEEFFFFSLQSELDKLSLLKKIRIP